ncbi:hypothetical protein FOCC_FOCC017294 [Frankliniella occidentalis]|uniref:Uncharacterized protein LOC113215591 n=1 Tax=Frankliniella occidentalis TaxID=133901 RepID=A0A9C6XAI0_FRAOC|nr:uncharacterized protein LOC113215591 [Frankliniella occidentalis]KAE8737244.1 hypothetical protein FOCC_FOCC017294 [Frankliniella occidentalis]
MTGDEEALNCDRDGPSTPDSCDGDQVIIHNEERVDLSPTPSVSNFLEESPTSSRNSSASTADDTSFNENDLNNQDNHNALDLALEPDSDHEAENQDLLNQRAEIPPGEVPFQRMRQEMDGKLKHRIQETVTAKYGEILLNALELSRHHNWNHTEKSNVLKLINSMFDQKVLGDSRYLLDELLFSSEGMHRFYFCEKCFTALPDVDFDSPDPVICPVEQCKLENDKTELKKEGYFVILDVPYQLEFLLKNDNVRKQLKNPFNLKNNNIEILSDLHDGSAYQAFINLLEPGNCRYISFTLCTDGSPLFKSSACSIWPCFLMINELPIVTRMDNLIVCGLWFGTKKAKMDVFLGPVVKHINSLSEPGFFLDIGNGKELFKGFLISCCIDSGARGEVQGINSHRGECSCNWCLHPGEEWGNARRFAFLFPFPELRNEVQMVNDWTDSMNQKIIINGCRFPSHLASATHFRIVDGMVFDYMHTVCEGSFKTFLKEWLDDSTYIGTETEKYEKLSSLLKKVKPPLEFRKAVRGLDALSYFTGREWENWGLFLSVCLLIDKLPEEYLRNWAYLVQAMHLLLKDNITSSMIFTAENLLIEFVGRVQYLYGFKMMRYNVHLLLHSVQNAKRWGPLFAISAFAFEHGIQKLKHVISANKGIPNQICRSISQDHAMNFLKNSLKSQNCETFEKSLSSSRFRSHMVGKIKLIGTSKKLTNLNEEEKFYCEQLNINPENCVCYNKIQFEGWTYSTSNYAKKSKTDNSIAWLITTKKVINIRKLFLDEEREKVWVVGSVVRCTPYKYPGTLNNISLNCHHLLQVASIDSDVIFETASSLNGVFVNLNLNHGHFVSPMPNCYNIF